MCGLALVVTYLLASHLGSFVWTLGPVIAVVPIQALRQHHVHQAISEELSAYRTLKLADALRPTETGADTRLTAPASADGLARTLDGRDSPAAPPTPQEKIDGVV